MEFTLNVLKSNPLFNKVESLVPFTVLF